MYERIALRAPVVKKKIAKSGQAFLSGFGNLYSCSVRCGGQGMGTSNFSWPM